MASILVHLEASEVMAAMRDDEVFAAQIFRKIGTALENGRFLDDVVYALEDEKQEDRLLLSKALRIFADAIDGSRREGA